MVLTTLRASDIYHIEKKDNSKRKSLRGKIWFHSNKLNVVYLDNTSRVPVKQ